MGQRGCEHTVFVAFLCIQPRLCRSYCKKLSVLVVILHAKTRLSIWLHLLYFIDCATICLISVIVLAAALRVASYLPFPYSALSSLTIVPTPLRDVVYDYVAKRRYDWFGKSPDCLVIKEKELLERFIDWEEILDKSRPGLWLSSNYQRFAS